MKRCLLAGSVATCICLGLGAPLLAAEPTADPTPPVEKIAAATKPAGQYLTDLHAFDRETQKDGYWLSGSGCEYSYPMMGGMGAGYGYGCNGREVGTSAVSTIGYEHIRPGYDVRTLVAAANILARDGQQQACEGVFAATRNSYKLYVADMHNTNAPIADLPGWRQRQIDAAGPVTAMGNALRSDQLVGSEVRNPQNEALGSHDDTVMSPQTGKMAYLVIARGGLFGIDQKYVAVPWPDFKITRSASLLVLNTTKSVMEAGPLVNHDQFAKPGLFDQESQKVDAYWKTHLSDAATKISG